MSRKTALIGAGVLTGMITGALLILSFFSEVQANDGPGAPAPVTVVDNTTSQELSEFEAALARRELALQDQLAQRQLAIETLDETYKEQFAALDDRLAEANSQLVDASERVEALQTEAAGIQGEIEAADQTFQEEMTGLQNGLVYQDSQIRAELEMVYAQLQQAYEQIAAQEALAMSSGGGGGGSSSDSHDDDSDHDDHDDDDHDDDDHDEDHEDGDDDHDDD